MTRDKADLTVNSAHPGDANEYVVREVLKRLNGANGPRKMEEIDQLPYSGVDFQEVYKTLSKEWKRLLLVAIGGAMAAGFIAVALPNMYTASALIIPPAKPQSLSTLMMGQLGGLTGALAPSLGLKDPNEMYIGILRSRTTNDELVRQFSLQQVYSDENTESASRKLLDRTSVVLGRDAMIKISVQDRDPKRAAGLANAFVAELNRQNNRFAITESGQRRLFFEHEVDVEKDELVKAESRLKETQQRTGVVEVSNQAQLVISSIARLRAEIAMQEVSLERLRTGATSENPEVAKRQMGLSALRSELTKLESGDIRRRSGDPIIPVANVPQAGLENFRALRDVKFHETLFEVLSKQYEAARIDEAKEAPVIQVVDPAVSPQRKSGPPRALIIILGTCLSTIGGMIWVYFGRGSALNERSLRVPGAELSTT